jgi:hypothetical protein
MSHFIRMLGRYNVRFSERVGLSCFARGDVSKMAHQVNKGRNRPSVVWFICCARNSSRNTASQIRTFSVA